MKSRMFLVALVAFLLGAVSASTAFRSPIELVPATFAQNQPAPQATSTTWLKGTTEEKFAQTEKHLRGLDVSMAEIGYRYDELVLAVKTRNWEYAKYQTEKIDLSLRRAIERRPKRAKSSMPFLNESIPPVMDAIKNRNPEKLDVTLKILQNGCIQCHRAENVLYMGRQFAMIQPTSEAAANAIRDYKQVLTPDFLAVANRSQGRRIFAETCANCHPLFGERETIGPGPDLTVLQRSNLDYLLTRIVDPNSLIGLDYQMVIVLTNDGRTISGLVKQEGENSLTIQTATETVTIPTDEIEDRSISKVSMMPDDLLQKLSNEQVRDLIGYIQGSKQAPLPPK